MIPPPTTTTSAVWVSLDTEEMLALPDWWQVSTNDQGAERRARLAAARLYLVCPPFASAGDRLANLLWEAVTGGVNIVQVREKQLGDDELLEIARAAREVCEQVGALLVVNDRPLVAREAGADGVHVGQDDMPVAEVRELVGPDMLIGLSTHARHEIDAAAANASSGVADQAGASGPDYIGVGPVYETPTKPGRPAVGLELVRYAAAHATVPFFAIGGLDAGNLSEAVDAGARRAVVLRAIADAGNPRGSAQALRALLERQPLEAPA
jgi:thiamine-phosphate pyrophosphorylase